MDSVISAVVSPIINCIVTPLSPQLGYLFNAGTKVKDLKTKISKDLTLTKEQVQEQIETDRAASDEVVPRKRVKEWMEEVQAMEKVMANIDEDYNHRKTCLAGCPINCWSSYTIGKRAAMAALGAKELIRERQSFDVLTKRAAPAIRRILSLPEATTASTELYVREASSYLQDEEVGMIGIWGMGGVGKTTLLKRINNHPCVEAAGFDYVILVVSSHDLNRATVQCLRRACLLEEGDASYAPTVKTHDTIRWNGFMDDIRLQKEMDGYKSSQAEARIRRCNRIERG